MTFQKYIGIDYSGGGTPLTRSAGLQVYLAMTDRLPKRVNPPSTPKGQNRNWCRKEVAAWLIEQAKSGKPFIAGLDFSFSLPLSYFQRYGLDDWDAFLANFVEHWPTDQDDATVRISERAIPAPEQPTVSHHRAVDILAEEQLPVRRARAGGEVHSCPGFLGCIGFGRRSGSRSTLGV